MLLSASVAFIRARGHLMLFISALTLIPCFWHKRIEAGDLPSHTYNAWLAQLIRQGRAPGLFIHWRWNNILADLALQKIGALVGFIAAERIVVAISVLLFFWGAFALITVANARAPWFLVPAIAMVTYGWTFYSGFLNFYLSVGLAFFAVALLWRGAGADLVVGSVLAIFAFLAHPMGFACLLGLAVYTRLGDRLLGWKRWCLLVVAFLVVVGLHYYAIRLGGEGWHSRGFYKMSGFDQLVLFGGRYKYLAYATAVVVISFPLTAALQREKIRNVQTARPTLELWILLIVAAGVLPELWPFPQYALPFGYAISRLTAITAVVGLCAVGSATPRRWHLLSLFGCAAIFFAWTFQDTAILNDMERQASLLVNTLPYGRRVIATIDSPEDSRLIYIGHIVDRACMDRCFSYANYEPSSGQFLIRARPGSPLATDSIEDSMNMQGGIYQVRGQDLPINQIYQCEEKDPYRLCMRELSAGRVRTQSKE
jgi:hypothetical protein